MITVFDRSPVSPTYATSGAYVYYKDLGPRPVCNGCGIIEDCPECQLDQPFQIPVVAGDLIYLQYRLSDLYNTDPTDPEFGWKNASDDFWLQATLEFNDSTELALDSQNIIAGKSVGYFSGSYQNLVLNSQRIQDYLNTLPSDATCFRIRVNTFRNEPEPYLVIGAFYETLPPPPGLLSGAFIWVQETGLFYRAINGAWVVYPTDVEFVFNKQDGKYYEFSGEEWFEIPSIPVTKVADGLCLSSWYRFVKCEMTIKIEGIHGEVDCQGNYYGGDENSRFRDRYRIYASFEHNGYITEKEVNDEDIVQFQRQSEQYLLRSTKGHPMPIVKRIANSIMGNSFFVEQNSYTNLSEFNKINETGLYWFFSMTMQRLSCESTSGCVDEIYTVPILVCDEPNCPEVGEPVSLVGELGDYNDSAACGTTHVVPAATVRDSDGNILGQVDAGEELVIDCSGGDPSGPCEPVTVRNSDSSFLEEPASGETLVLEDYTINVILDGVTVATDTAPAMTDITVNINWV